MKYTKNTFPIQQKCTGEMAEIHCYTFSANIPGPHIYLQANLHGPEIFGTSLLGQLIDHLQTRKDIPGSVTIVPCANPIGVQQKSYNAITGRWNALTGNNWNRIFSLPSSISSQKEAIAYYEDIQKNSGSSVEQTLASTLKLLSKDASHVIDIHTTGTQTIDHLFTHESALPCFAALGSDLAILYTVEDNYGAFDESHVLFDSTKLSCTWEVYHHGKNDIHVAEKKLAQLISCIENIWDNKKDTQQRIPAYPIANTTELYSPLGGYITWEIKAGDNVAPGTCYARLYQPWNQQTHALKAQHPFILIATYGIDAVSQGDPIGFVVKK